MSLVILVFMNINFLSLISLLSKNSYPIELLCVMFLIFYFHKLLLLHKYTLKRLIISFYLSTQSLSLSSATADTYTRCSSSLALTTSVLLVDCPIFTDRIPSHPMTTWSRKNIFKTNQLSPNMVASTKHALFTITTSLVNEPNYLTTAFKYQEWRNVMANEFYAFIHNKTWTLSPHKSHINIIGYK